jgi:tRNA A37 threonylcarbamoyladenosine modification protein TsaB
MANLIIQTVFPQAQLILTDGDWKLTDQESWTSQKDEVRQLPARIEQLLQRNGLKWQDLKKIVTITGIGNFSATRIGVTISNILAMVVAAEIYELKLEEQPDNAALLELVQTRMTEGWQPVKLAVPVYRSEPMISPSKKKQFNNS